MESPAVKSRGRPRKRRREEEQNGGENVDGNGDVEDVVMRNDGDGNDGNEKGDVKNAGRVRKRGRPPKRRAVEIRGEETVGRYVLKEFEDSGVFLGKIVSYDSGLYRVDYEDGDFEDLDSEELREYLIGDERQKFVGDMLDRKKKLDDNVAEKSSVKAKMDVGKGEAVKAKSGGRKKGAAKLKTGDAKGDDVKVKTGGAKGNAVKSVDEVVKGNVAESIDNVEKQDGGNVQSDMKVEVPKLSECSDDEVDGSEVDDDISDSSSDSCEYGQGWDTRSEIEIPATPPPELPLSSGTVGVPEEFVSHLFSVYGFLRSFSVRLFLSPFTLDDLVGCLNCNVPTTLLDAIHVALLRALRKHLEAQASDGSELASKCLRCNDWSLLDNLTWPVYLVHYLMVMGHFDRKEWKGFYIDVLQKDYCTLSVGMKLTVLQILCDDTLDTAEMRAEIDTREESEVGVDSDGIMSISLESGPRKVYPRLAKTSVGKDRENLNSEQETNIGNVKDQETKPGNNDDDVNWDECRLCGMDGVLLCCDGCPSAYHSRCIGVNKLSIPEGDWFCHDCKISRVGPPIATGTLLRGAEAFGVDPYAQLFLGTCNHLLVLKVSVNPSQFVRYYNCNDIPKVVTALCSSPHHAASYSGICQAILKYWELPQVWLPPLVSNQTLVTLEKKEDDFVLPFAENGNQVHDKAVHENFENGTRENTLNYVSGTEKSFVTLGPDDISLVAPIQNGVVMQTMNEPTLDEAAVAPIQNGIIMSSKVSDPAQLSYSSHQGLVNGSSMTGISSCNSGYKSISTGLKNGISLPGNLYLHRKAESNEATGRAAKQQKNNCLYMGSLFKPYSYINHYVHGNFAASAAANFAELSSDENRPSEVHSSDPRKAMSANVTLQAKAFASAATRFFWPSTEKKLIEIPRERCSWCLHCKACSGTTRKACLLNQAALNATRSAMRFCSGLKLVKNVEGGLYGIAAYMLYLEESLRGLIVGPFQSSSNQIQWRKQVEQASTCKEMKSLLLELEENLCTNALSSEWTKLVDNWMDENSVPQSVCAAASVQKRGTGRRRKQPATPEVIADDSNDSLSDLNWRSGKLSKLVFQRGTIPCSVLRKAARQGGSKRLPGIYYAEGSDVPKRSRQYIWRAAVQMSMNASGLALQMRYLDYHIKWSDLLRPDQNLQDGKGPETEAFAFRNARICGKKVVENKIMYGVVFGHQKHLSSRLMKSIIEKEESEDGKEKYWFLETRIPLYLVKEYEENAEKTYVPPPKKPERYSKHQKRQLKASRKRATFLYLTRRRDELQTCFCASCHRDVLLGLSVMCSACEGFCHKACTMSSTVMTSDDVEFVTTCKQCSRGKALTQNNCAVESPTSPLVVQGQEYQNSAAVSKSAKLKVTSQQCQNSMAASKSSKAKSNGKKPLSVGTLESLSDRKPASSDSSKSKKRPCHWGLIWKKKPCDGDGSEFRSNNLIFRGSAYGVNLSPECQLCQKPYTPHLMYIRCETCQNWHHADAVELDESRLSCLVGYKCCRCRRIKTPACPYVDKKPEIKKIRIKGPKEDSALADSVSEAPSEPSESLPSTPMSLMEDDVLIEFDDPLLLSVSKVEQIPEPKEEVHYDWNTAFAPGPQKLPVRRHIKNERDDDGLIWGDYSSVQLPTSDETKNLPGTLSEWDVSNDGLEDGTQLDYENFNFENTDFEPQTYFSFTELLEADDTNQFGGVDVSGDAWENLACEYSQSGFPEHCELGSSNDHVPAASMDAALDVSCNICLQSTPNPDLACHMCGLQIHSQCSPGEEISQGNIWMCVNCRGWR